MPTTPQTADQMTVALRESLNQLSKVKVKPPPFSSYWRRTAARMTVNSYVVVYRSATGMTTREVKLNLGDYLRVIVEESGNEWRLTMCHGQLVVTRETRASEKAARSAGRAWLGKRLAALRPAYAQAEANVSATPLSLGYKVAS